MSTISPLKEWQSPSTPLSVKRDEVVLQNVLDLNKNTRKSKIFEMRKKSKDNVEVRIVDL